ncbi:MAG: TIGR03790 family protein [Opitutaceae bacterium]
MLLLGWLASGLRGDLPPPARVILLVNTNDPDSRRIAEHYATVRGVPRANIIAQPMPLTETITWSEFVTTVWQPLQDELVRRQWIDAIPMDRRDTVGRKIYAIGSHRISYLVVCRGVPLRIGHDAALYALQPGPIGQVELRTNEGAVDSELSLLAQIDYPINGFVVNPLFNNDHLSSEDLTKVVRVSRLDGPSADEAFALVDLAVAAERTGLLGRAYVDLNGKNPEGDRWLESVVTQLREMGFDFDVDRTPNTFPATARFDAPVLYFGWYAGTINGPFMLPGFKFPPGAIAEHIHSYSAQSLHVADAGWTGPFVARGVTATVGNVFEPFLEFLHRPDLLLRALARGDTFGEAAYYAEPMLSWQAIAVGDPLYRPFARTLEQQWKDRQNLPAALAGYVAVREMQRLETTQNLAVSLAPVMEFQEAHPSLAFAFYQAKKQERAGDLAGAVRALEGFTPPETLPAGEWALAREAGSLLEHAKAPAAAEKFYVSLLRSPALPSELRVPWLREAIQVAQAAANPEQALEWAKELDRLDLPVRK